MRRGDAIDRFTVLEPLGTCENGLVVSAYDPTLDRRVAIKLVRSAAPGELIRQAQATARLSPPNVVAVYEAGTADEHVFLAMELVDGETLAARLKRGLRGWREVLGLFFQAGRGLAAAHRAGLVHRDFRPENMLVGRDGTVRVTHLKMKDGETVEADQLHFRQALGEALPADAPRWVRAALARGWPSMDALVAALERDPASVRRRWLTLAGAAVTAVAGAALWFARAEQDPCPPARDKVAGIWDAPARDRVRAAFLATVQPHAADVFARVERTLEARLEAWVAGHAEACRATCVRGEQSESLLDLRMQRLERTRRQIQTLPELWQEEVKLDDAVRAALTTGDLEACADTEALTTPVPPPRDPDSARRLDELKNGRESFQLRV